MARPARAFLRVGFVLVDDSAPRLPCDDRAVPRADDVFTIELSPGRQLDQVVDLQATIATVLRTLRERYPQLTEDDSPDLAITVSDGSAFSTSPEVEKQETSAPPSAARPDPAEVYRAEKKNPERCRRANDRDAEVARIVAGADAALEEAKQRRFRVGGRRS